MAAPETAPPAIETQALAQAFPSGFWLRERAILHGIDLRVARGEFLGLVGPNGSGKSTFLRVLAAIDAPRGGVVRIQGHDISSAEARRRIGFVPEDSPFPPELTARGTLDLCGALHRVPQRERRERAAKWLERVGLTQAAARRLSTFSRGMLRRLGLAAAMLHEPDVLLLDEPTAGLDAQGFDVFLGVLDEARARGTTLVVASHLLTDLQQRCDRLAVMLDGRLAAIAPPLELIERLGTRAEVDVKLQGADERALSELAREAAARGATWRGVEPSQSNLIELYRVLGGERRP
jgi:ABC-type multidrug transport system ATPase subunit